MIHLWRLVRTKHIQSMGLASGTATKDRIWNPKNGHFQYEREPLGFCSSSSSFSGVKKVRDLEAKPKKLDPPKVKYPKRSNHQSERSLASDPEVQMVSTDRNTFIYFPHFTELHPIIWPKNTARSQHEPTGARHRRSSASTGGFASWPSSMLCLWKGTIFHRIQKGKNTNFWQFSIATVDLGNYWGSSEILGL